ncbi:TonB-dependent receptor domain-containing protein [Candidatus Latescibacterota bacterium]
MISMQFTHTQNPAKTLLLLIFAVFISYQSWAQTNSETGSIFGTVTDRVTNSPLYGASVYIIDTQKGIMADENGEYTIKQVPPGTYNIRFSMIGYQALIKTNVVVSPGRGTEISVSLDQTPIEIESVTVIAKESYFEKDPEAEVSGRTIDTQEIMNASGGLMDIQRVVQVLPSVVSGSDQMNEIIVRGGNYGENLFVMDGIEIPNPNHFAAQGIGGGPISILRAEFISDVSFIAGAFPAKYGDKASSVMDISLRRGNRERLLTNLDMGMAGLGFIAEGPIGENGSFLFSARKSYLDLIISSFGMTAVPRYYNLQSKVTYSLGSKHTLLWNTVYGSDSIRIEPGEDVDGEDENVDQSTDLIISGLTLKSALSRNLYSEMVLSHVRNNWELEVWDTGVERSEAFYNNKSVETETNLKYDINWFIGKHELSGGFSLKNSGFDHDIWANEDTVHTYDTSFATAREDTVTGIFLTYPEWIDENSVSTVKSAAYVQVRLNPTSRLSLRLGERYDHHSYINKGRFAHRIGSRYRLTDNISLNASYGVHHQSPSYIMLTAHENNKKNLEYYRTKQFVLGTEWFPRPDTRVTVEAYTKRYLRVPVMKSDTTPDPWDSSEGEMVNAAKGHAEGIEFYVHRKMSTSYMYILSYSFYRALYEDPRNGDERPWDFDHKNVFTFSTAKRWRMTDIEWYKNMRKKVWYKALGWILPFGNEVLLSAKWRFTGGRPFTEPTYLRSNHFWIVPQDTEVNTERFPDYHRFDIRLDRRYYYRNWSLVVYFDIMNAYGRKNIWDYTRDDYGDVDNIYQFSTFPVGGFNIEF